MKLTTLLLFLGASTFACGPRRVVVVHEQGTVQPAGDEETEEQADADDEPPVAVVETPPPSPGPTYVWVGGRHRWIGGRWVWNGGRWVVGRPGHVWVPGHWEHRGRRVHVFVPGHWRR